jgi:flavin-dependent dehydrogenase
MIYEVIVIGAGPAGCVAAMELAKNNIWVAIIDPLQVLRRKVGESLPSSAKPLLKKLELLEMVESGGHLISYGNQSCWGSTELQEQDFITDPSGSGWHLDRNKFDSDLRTKTMQMGIPILNDRVQSIQKNTNGWSVQTTKQNYESAFLIDASGRNSILSRQKKINRTTDDQLVCSYLWVESKDTDQDSRTLIEATSNGWWYTSKLPGKTRVVAFHTDADLLNEQLLKTELESTTYIKKYVEGQNILSNTFRQGAGGSMLFQCAGTGWIACGDAAMTYDPLSSQGIFNALYTGFLAAEAIVKLTEGNNKALLEYDNRLTEIRNAYLKHHQIYYALESRWPDQKFWQRRWPQAQPEMTDYSVTS